MCGQGNAWPGPRKDPWRVEGFEKRELASRPNQERLETQKPQQQSRGGVGGGPMESASVASAFQKFVCGKKVKGTWGLRSESPNFVL